jgi:hypothetical protein
MQTTQDTFTLITNMDQTTFQDLFDEEIVLTDTVREAILEKHPEVGDFIDQVGEILAHPDEVRKSVRDERSVLYYRFRSDVLNGKWLVVVIKRIDRNFVSTIYATDRIKSGDVLWKKQT